MTGQREVLFASAVRTPIGNYGGSLASEPPTRLGALVVQEALDRAAVDPASVDHVVFGNVIHTDVRDMYLSRTIAVSAGIPVEVPALTVNRLCGSGLQAIISAAQTILLGDSNVAVAGGAESMSRAQYWAPAQRWGSRMNDAKLVDAMMGALRDPFDDCHMGMTAENVAERWGITREAQDALALESHSRASAAQDDGRFKSQILPIEVRSREGSLVIDRDEHVRGDLTLEDLTKLRPAFKSDGTVTAGNASGINDGAAAVVLMEKETADALGMPPLGRLVAYSHVGVDPKYMGIGPVPAVQKLLDKTRLTVADIDVWELNEAFAAQALAVMHDLSLPSDRTNPNGSGISLGHPIGATGTLITVKCLYELRRTGGRYGIVTMCIGGGQGIAALIERT